MALHETVTPSGLLIEFEDGEPHPDNGVNPKTGEPKGKKRQYTVDGVRPPRGSVSGIVAMLDKSEGLKYWAEKLGVAGSIELAREGGLPLNPDAALGQLTRHGLRHFQVSDQKAKRGRLSHEDLVRFAAGEQLAPLDTYPVEDRGFVRGLAACLADLRPRIVRSEFMVASVEHGFCGRPDLQAEVGAARFPDGTPTPLGLGLWDLKTVDKLPRNKPTKACPEGPVKTPYPENLHQVGLYEVASVESGYPKTAYRAVIRVDAEGGWDFTCSWLEPEVSLALLPAFDAWKASGQRVKRPTDQRPVGFGEPVAA